MTADYEYFKKEILKMTSIDLNAYKEKQMKRRIDNLILKNRITGYDNYINAIRGDKELFNEFINYITINVSEFYRNPDQWAYMDKQIIQADSATGLRYGVRRVPPEMNRIHWLWHFQDICRFQVSG